MRTMVKFTVSTQEVNPLVKDGTSSKRWSP